MPTYYVAPTGSAGNPGTIGSPWSLAHAATGAGGTLTSGDVVIMTGSFQLGTAPSYTLTVTSACNGHIAFVNSSLWMRDGGYYDYSAADAPLSLWMGDDNEGAHPITLDDLRIQGRMRVGNWASATVTDNSVTAGDDALPWTLGRALVQLQPTPSPYTKFTWDRNRYAHNGDARIMLPVSTMQNLASWRTTTGYDANGTHVVGEFTGVETQFVTSAVDSARATATVWNYDGASSIPLDVSPLLAPGDGYALYHVYDWVTSGAQTLSGTYSGGTLTVPMTAKTPPTPQGGTTLPNLPNTFGVFVLLRTSDAPRRRSMIGASRIAAAMIAGAEALPSVPLPQPQVQGLARRRRRRLGAAR